jgi:hypothetical protein
VTWSGGRARETVVTIELLSMLREVCDSGISKKWTQLR